MKLEKILIFYLLIFVVFTANGQCDRWQNAINYEMFIDFDVETHNYYGKQTVVFTNESPDTLKKVYFHLFLNAFKPGSSMDVRSRTISDPDGRVRDRISQLSPQEIGFQRIQKLIQNEKRLDYIEHETILEVFLEDDILPGGILELYMEYDAQVPLQIRRNGRMNEEGIHYSMAQWYPRMCQYDEKGWHTNPYIGREFYGPFGDFDVKIRIDKNYLLGGTGYLQNTGEIGKGYSEKFTPKLDDKLTWHFKADRVHDFMWAADPEYTHDSYETKDGITLRFFYRKNERTEENWAALQPIMADAFDFIQERFGKYPYKQYAFVQGGDGGMEYPMATLITGNRNLRSLVGVSVHELMHSWYQGVLGFNESLYHWMDEGFTSYASEIVMDHLIRKGLIPGVEPAARLFSGSSAGYKNIVRAGIEEPMSTHADHFDRNVSYGISAYSKGALYLHQLSYVIGQENLDKTLLSFYDRCAFKHPNDHDIRRIAEQVSGIELKWYNEYWVYSTKIIDYAIDTVLAVNNSQSRIILDRIGNMPLSVDVVCTLKDGSTHMYHIPLDLMLQAKPDEGLADRFYESNAWKWVYPRYLLTVDLPFDQIQSVEIDPSKRMQDIDLDNNMWPRQTK
jgi:hypothetical protein